MKIARIAAAAALLFSSHALSADVSTVYRATAETAAQIKTFDPKVQQAIDAMGIKVIPGNECIVFAYHPERTPNAGWSIDTSGTPHSIYSSFSVKDLYQLTIFNKYRDPKQSVLINQFSTDPTFYYQAPNFHARLYDKDMVDAHDAYTLWMAKDRAYPDQSASLTGLTSPYREVPYDQHKHPHEHIFEIKNYVLQPQSNASYDQIKNACVAPIAGQQQVCFCIGTHN